MAAHLQMAPRGQPAHAGSPSPGPPRGPESVADRPPADPGSLRGGWASAGTRWCGEEGSVETGEEREAGGGSQPAWSKMEELEGRAVPSAHPGFHSACWVSAGHRTPSSRPCSVLLWWQCGRGAYSSRRQRLPLIRGSRGTVRGGRRVGLAGRRLRRRRGISAMAACRLRGERWWDGRGSAWYPGHPSRLGFGVGHVLGGCRGRSRGPGLRHGRRRRHRGSGRSRALAWKEN